MTETRYNVIYRGKILDGFEFNTAKRNLAKIYAISEEKAEKILKSRQVVLKKNLGPAEAKKFATAIKNAGMAVALARVPAGSGTAASGLSPAARAMEQSLKAAMAAAPPDLPGTFEETGEDAPTAEQARPPKASAKAERLPFRFLGTGSEYFKIWIVNVILSILTLGIYSAWAKVRRKQYFYGNTQIDGASFEYLANPIKILKGRIIVVGFFTIYSLVSEMMPIVGSILSLVLVIFLPWLVVRALAFNARNSSFRNIRFGFDGTYRGAAQAYLLWPLLAGITLGILTPYVFYHQKKFMVEHSGYGATRFVFAATVRDYYRIFLGALVPVLLALAVLVGGQFAGTAGMAFLAPISMVVFLVIYLYLFAYYSVKTNNLLYTASRLGAHRFEMAMRVWGYGFLVLFNSILTAVTLGLFHPWAKVRVIQYKVAHLTLIPSGDLDGFVASEEKQVSAIGDEMSDFFDFDIGL
jgi:uncharacterized membrane protein YjgN (DUF898 family)